MHSKYRFTSDFRPVSDPRQSKFNTPEKTQQQSIRNKTSKKNISQQIQKKINHDFRPSVNDKTLIYGTTMPRVQEINQSLEIRPEDPTVNGHNIETMLAQKLKNFKIVSKTLKEYLKVEKVHQSSNKKSVKKSRTQSEKVKNIAFILKFIEAFNRAEIKDVSASTMSLIEQIVQNVGLAIENSNKRTKNRSKSQLLTSEAEQTENNKPKIQKTRNVVYSKIYPALNHNRKRSASHKIPQNKPEYRKIIQNPKSQKNRPISENEKFSQQSVEKQIQALTQQLVGLQQEGQILENIFEQFKDYKEEEKEQLIRSLEKIVRLQEEQLHNFQYQQKY